MIYVHVPFCRSFCTYCDFYSEIACRGKDAEAIERYVRGICAEIESRREEIEVSEGLKTTYIGGGTPSVLPISCLGRIVEALGVGPREEFTVEVNPEDIAGKGEDYVRGMLELGVNRISMGVQSFDDSLLKWMNRRHSADGARKAFRTLRSAGAGNISVDVIFGISHLTDDTLAASLDEICSWHPEHVSAYQLSIEEGSALAAMVADGRYSEAPEEQCRRQYDLICGKLADAGYTHYEVSNWARPGFEARHNSGYWKRLPYVGIGPGAHSFDGSVRSWNSEDLTGWTRESETLTKEDARVETIMLGLRTADGIDTHLCRQDALEMLLKEGALKKNGERISIPEDHLFVSDDIIRALL